MSGNHVAERCGVHVWRLAYDLGEMDDDSAARKLRQMVDDTSLRDREAMRCFAEDTALLLHSDAWARGLCTMRELRWSSY
jgi:hypothetical protein